MKSGLSRELIAARALEMTSRDGLAGLSMRKLGAELGVEAMSLYHYVENKSDLLRAMTDQLYNAIELPDLTPGLYWEDAVRSVVRSYHNVLVSNPGALELFLTQPSTSVAGLKVITWAFELLRSVGLPSDDAVAALHFTVSFVSGHVATELSSASSLTSIQAADLGSTDGPEAPPLYEEMSSVEPGVLFDAGLDMVIGGLRARFRLG